MARTKYVYIVMDGDKVHLVYTSKSEAEALVKHCNENLGESYTINIHPIQ